MVANAPAPHQEPLTDIRLTVDIDRPSKDCPDGYIGLSVEEKASKKVIYAADGKHTDDAMKRMLIDIHSFQQNGRSAWVNRIDRDKNGRER